MNSKTEELTFGALLVAVFGVLLVINRQTAGLFEDIIFFVLPIPMTIFSLRYGWKDSIPVFFCMVFLSFFLGTFYTIFYAAANAFLGIVLGTCLKNKWDLNQTQLLVMLLCAIFSVLGSVVLASLFGVDLQTEIGEMQKMISSLSESTGVDMTAGGVMISQATLMRIFIISMLFFGVLQGFVIFRLSLMILRRLRLPVPRPQPVGLYYPPKWSGYVSVLCVFMYLSSIMSPSENQLIQNLMQVFGLGGYLYLLVFGWIGMTMLLQRLFKGKTMRWLAGLLSLLMVFLFAYGILLVGFMYISTRLHDRLLGRV